jgi:hypothetical protein
MDWERFGIRGMRFTHKLTVGFGLVAALSLVIAGLFFVTLRQ